jgi:hypothetical protein
MIDLRPAKLEVLMDQQRTIQFDLNSFNALEKHYGDINKAMAELEKIGKGKDYVKTITVFIWAGLATDFITSKKPLQVEEVAQYIGLAGLNALGPEIAKAISASIPAPEGESA